MGKRITQQARGRGGPVFRVRKRAYRLKIGYPLLKTEGKAKVLKLINSPAHSAPLGKVKIENEIFYVPAHEGMYEGQEIEINGETKTGNILKLNKIPLGTKIFNIERYPGKGGVYIRSSGCSGIITSKDKKGVEVNINKRIIKLNNNCRAIIGTIAGGGRLSKPFVKAGKKHYLMKSKGRKWHRTSGIKTNAVDHPFGSGRGKRIKSKISKRNAPAGKKVGHIKPKKTGHKK